MQVFDGGGEIWAENRFLTNARNILGQYLSKIYLFIFVNIYPKLLERSVERSSVYSVD